MRKQRKEVANYGVRKKWKKIYRAKILISKKMYSVEIHLQKY